MYALKSFIRDNKGRASKPKTQVLGQRFARLLQGKTMSSHTVTTVVGLLPFYRSPGQAPLGENLTPVVVVCDKPGQRRRKRTQAVIYIKPLGEVKGSERLHIIVGYQS